MNREARSSQWDRIKIRTAECHEREFKCGRNG